MNKKAVLLSVQPKWCALIANGKKTVEVRKTIPKIETPFKCYIYQSKSKDRLIYVMKDGDENYGEIYHGKPVFITTYSVYSNPYEQKVIGEFICDTIISHCEWQTLILLNSGGVYGVSSCLNTPMVQNFMAGISQI